MAISTVQPPSKRPTATSHTGFQSELNVRSLVSWPSQRPPTGVTANAVCPAYVDTDMTKRSVENIMDKTGRTSAEAQTALEKMTPLGRLLKPGEVAAAVAFLASPEAAAINGQALVLDGGGLQQ